MGLWFSRLAAYFGEREARILVLGLDNAGKTTILCTIAHCAVCMLARHHASCIATFTDRLHVGEVVSTIPSAS